MVNLAHEPNSAMELAKMKNLLSEHINKMDRPFGEFNYSDNAAMPGQIENEIKLVKQIKVKGKEVIVPKKIKESWQKTNKQ